MAFNFQNTFKTFKMPFGVHKDKLLDDVPAQYLLWLVDQSGFAERNPVIAAYVERNKKGLRKQSKNA